MSESKKYIFANPAACGGITPARIRLLEKIARETGALLQGLDTKSAEEFDNLIISLVRENDTVVFAGGDGTFHQGLNTVYKKKVTIGYIPFGTGNAAAYALSIIKPGPVSALSFSNEKTMLNVLKKSRIEKMDLIEVKSDELGLSRAGMFSSAGWCAKMSGERKGKGLAGYLIPAVKNLMTEYYEQDVKIYCDEKLIWNGPNTLAVGTKSKFYGAGMMIAPDASLNDNFIDIVIYNLPAAKMAAFMATSFLGKKPSPAFSTKGKSISIESNSGSMPIQIDGEFYGETSKVSYKILTDAIKVIHG